MTGPLIGVEGLTKTYRSRSRTVHALSGLDLAVPEGIVKGLLGPNGAGKTTVVKVLTTLITPDAGTARIDGVDVVAHPARIRRMIGASGQYAAVDENLTGTENLRMVGRLYHLGAATARRRAAELLEPFDLEEAGDRTVKGYSGGMRRRLDLAGALVIRPRVLFLDEPTTGLDPRSRIGLWDVIRSLVQDGTTVLLTTQYLEEADQLADEISVIDDRNVIAAGPPDELKTRLGGHRVVVVLQDGADAARASDVLARHGEGTPTFGEQGRELHIPVQEGPQALQRILADLDAQGVGLHDAGMRRPALDDVFLSLTGHTTAQAAGDEKASGNAVSATGGGQHR
ncbi:ATP-binding cassette domain-containing protein [Kocuria aegyptia]|uniref:Daunorubicin resistance protein DrrA family ABC transporter ATP-binding protein n=1 Tax=Kocuria aegyptia TaxID=330943 RepID=A0ABN2KJZ5_9MICC